MIINASPIELGHSLLVPDRIQGKHPQILTEKSLVLAIRYSYRFYFVKKKITNYVIKENCCQFIVISTFSCLG